MWAKIRRSKKEVTQTEFYSYLLNLPVIFSTRDAELIFNSLLLDKSNNALDFNDLQRILMLANFRKAAEVPRLSEHSGHFDSERNITS